MLMVTITISEQRSLDVFAKEFLSQLTGGRVLWKAAISRHEIIISVSKFLVV